MFAKKIIPVGQDYSVLKEFIDNRIFDNRYTPDIAELEKYEFQLFFACDELQRELSRYQEIENSVYYANAYTTKSFQYFVSKTGGWEHPIPLETEMSEPVSRLLPLPGKIKGELHLIEPWQFKKLDFVYKNTIQFERKRVRLLVPYTELLHILDCNKNGETILQLLKGWEDRKIETPEKVHVIRAWMYVGIPDFWCDIVDAGYHFGAVPNFVPKVNKWFGKANRYYKYTRKNEQI